MRKSLIVLFALAAAASCNVAIPERIDFGISEKDFVISSSGGEASAQILSDGEVVLTLDKTADWASILSPLSFTGDGEVNVNFTENKGLQRSLNVALSYKGGLKIDTLHFRQEGHVAFFKLKDHALFIDSRSARTTDVALSTNIDPQLISYNVNYIGDETGWIQNVTISGDKISVSTLTSQSAKVKKAIVTISHSDGWGKTLCDVMSINLSNNSGAFGDAIDFPGLRALATEGSKTIDSDLILKGIVVSDCRSRNMDMNYNTAYNVVDTTSSLKTAYIESENGTYGFRLLFDEASDNNLTLNQKVEIMLVGKTITKETGPIRYTISGLGIEDIKVNGTAESTPAKVKSISQLTDDDVNTFVEIPNTEFLNKEGSLSNVFDAFTLPASHNKASVSKKCNSDCWPIMLIDNEGHSILAIVNMMCPWRRTGTGVPKGVGSLKGILVHNDQPRFGNMGRYQIRVIDESGFAQPTSSASSYSVLMKWDGKPYKYTFTNYGNAFPYVETSGGMDTVIPSDDFVKSTGNHAGELYFENKMGLAMSGTKAIRPCRTYDALKNSGSPGSGQVDNRGLSIQCNIGGFYNWNEDGSIKSYNGIVSRFSTEALSGKKLFLYFSFCCGGNDYHSFKNFPSKWAVDYSIDNGANWTIVNADESGEPYVYLRSFCFSGPTVIDGRGYYPSYSAGMGFTEHFYALPDNIIGKTKVLVRIRPYDTVVTTIPDDPSASIEGGKAYKEISVYQDIRINRINFLTK